MITKIKNFFIKTLASGFGLGLMPKAPGTFGTLLGIPFVISLHAQNHANYVYITLAFTIFACIVAHFAGPLFGESDSPKIVIDEVAGFLVTMTWLPHTWYALGAGFVLFRLFDALKPGPIGWLDRNVKGGIGVVVDDVAAGLVANIILQVVCNYSEILGKRI